MQPKGKLSATKRDLNATKREINATKRDGFIATFFKNKLQ